MEKARRRYLSSPFKFLILIGAFLLIVVLATSQDHSTLATGRSVGSGVAEVEAAGSRMNYLPIVSKYGTSATGPMYGVNFISSAEDPADEQQYQNGMATGASWNRWPFYWYKVEQGQGNFDWSDHDAVVENDLAHGLKINAILMGTPAFYASSEGNEVDPDRPLQSGMFEMQAAQTATPAGLYAAVFSDGSDVPGPGKHINEQNRWARYVYKTVSRYKPGGILAQAHGWPLGVGVTHWEMWNEPDLPWFWNSSLADYARLLKVGFLAARQADPAAKILFAGLANNFEKIDYYEDVLQIYSDDSMAAQFGYFHDILATHNYFYSWQSWFHVYRAANTMTEYGLNKPIWLNENGVAAWDDYPGPTWDPASPLRATMDEQASFIIQSALYATFAGADAIFHFQLYDGCGNQPRGTDFPPHDGSLCNDSNYPICAGDANGLFRNPVDAACFTQHPRPETSRPNLDAFRVLTTHFRNVEPLWRLRPGGDNPYDGPQEWIAFYQPATQERIIGLWSRVGTEQTAVITATAGSALLVEPNGTTRTITPSGGHYEISLPAATNQNAPWDPSLYAIGGRPLILIEKDTMGPSVAATVTSAGETIELKWEGNDGLGSGILSYDVSISVNGGPLFNWLTETKLKGLDLAAESGKQYTIIVRARDRAGNVGRPQTLSVTAG